MLPKPPRGVLKKQRQPVCPDNRQTESALQESEKRLNQIVQGLTIAAFVIDPHHLITHCNRALENLTGISAKELVGTTDQWKTFYSEKRPTLADLIVDRVSEDVIAGFYADKYRRSALIEGAYEVEDFFPRVGRDGRWLFFTAAPLLDDTGGITGAIETLQDVTQKNRMMRNNEAMLRISMALPEYPELQDLLYYINSQIKRLLCSEGALVVLHDEIKGDLFILGAAYDDLATERRVQEVRFPMDKLASGQVIQSGEPMIINDTSINRHLSDKRDQKFGYHTRNLVIVPLKSSERTIGTLCAINKKEGRFDPSDIELLSLIAGTVALSIENARFSEDLKKAYTEVTGLNRAKDKAINHLSHELKTPVAIITSSLDLLIKKISDQSPPVWKPTVLRIQRNLNRILDIQYELDDIMQGKELKAYGMLTLLLDQCTDELESLIAENAGASDLIARLRNRIDELFGPAIAVSQKIDLDQTLLNRLECLEPRISERRIDMIHCIEPVPPIFLPLEVMQKVLDGLIRNAVENTPDEGKIELDVHKSGAGAVLRVHDYGVGIPAEAQKRIFEGFSSSRDMASYSTRKPFEFNAGGRGADLLRMKIFSERYHFKIDMRSTRCKYIPGETDLCPGRISSCRFCTRPEDCFRSGQTTFWLYFPAATG